MVDAPAPRKRSRGDWIDEMRMRMPWIPRRLLRLWADQWIEVGDGDLAWQAVRQTDDYEQFFGGNLRDDGTVRMEEAEYHSRIEFFDDTIRSVGLNAKPFRQFYPDLIAGNVDPEEFYREVDAITERVLLATPEIAKWYENAGYTEDFPMLSMRQAILASALHPEIGAQLLNKQITMAEIGGEGEIRGFEITRGLARRMAEAGISRDEAQGFFGEASELLPTLNVLAQRHADPDDDFDINEFNQAMILDDPYQRRRMMRLMRKERADFSQSGAFGVRASESGRQVGLEQR